MRHYLKLIKDNKIVFVPSILLSEWFDVIEKYRLPIEGGAIHINEDGICQGQFFYL